MRLMGENDRKISLLERLIQHARATARYSVYYGEGRDAYDVRGRVAHESIFNVNDGNYRCPRTQQGYSPFTTWTRGLAWAMCGFAELLEFLATVDDEELERSADETPSRQMRKAAEATCDFYIEQHADRWHSVLGYRRSWPGTSWAIGASDPPIHSIHHEPVDSSAAAIAAQGSAAVSASIWTTNATGKLG